MTDKELKIATELQEMANDAECKCEFFRPLLGAGCIRIGDANQSLATGTIINLPGADRKLRLPGGINRTIRR